MTDLEAIGILSNIVELAQQMICRPRSELAERRVRCEALEEKLEAAISTAQAGMSRYLDNAAPSLLIAIDRALLFRHYGIDDRADDWDAVIGHLMPLTRADAGAGLAALSEVLKERPTR